MTCLFFIFKIYEKEGDANKKKLSRNTIQKSILNTIGKWEGWNDSDFFTRNEWGAAYKTAVVAGAAANRWPPAVRRPKS